MELQEIPITFDYKGKHCEGTLSEVHGAGATGVFHLMINNFYRGQLINTQKGWAFYSNSGEMADLSNFFGEQVRLWFEKIS